MVFSDRHSIPVPDDGQDEPADGSTQAISISDASSENWGDVFQTILLDDSFLDGKLVSSGNLASRPSAGTDAPKLWVVTDAGSGDTGVYATFNDDSAWHPAVHHPVRNGTDNTVPIESPTDWLREGYIAGVAPGYQVVEDPRDHASGDVAIQAAHDAIVSNSTGNFFGVVWIPARDPDGAQIDIASTCLFDGGDPTSRFVSVVPRGWGMKSGGDALAVTIDDGSPAFDVAGGLLGGSSWFGDLVLEGAVANNDADGDDAAADAGAIRITNVQDAWCRNISARALGKANTTATHHIGDNTYNSFFTGWSWNDGSVGTNLPDAKFIRIDDADPHAVGGSPPGELYISQTTTYAAPANPFKTALEIADGADNIYLHDGRLEGCGAGGSPMVDVIVGQLYLDNMQMGRIEGTNSHHLVLSGGSGGIVVSASNRFKANDTGGDNIRLDTVAPTKIGSFADQEETTTNGGYAINDTTGGGPVTRVFPRPGTMEADVSYRSEPWNGEVFPDGWQRYRSGSDSVAAGGSVELNAFVSGRIRLHGMEITNNNAGEPELFPVVSWSTTSGNQSMTVIENSGSVGADFDWHIERYVD